jgi:hypothetical protein
MKKIGENLVANVDAGWRATALAIDQAVVTSTPVDTGRARSNWRAGVGANPGGVVPAASPGVGGSTAAESASQAIDDATAVIGGADGDIIYISNNLPYIQALNDGSSAQAPAGFVELAVQAGQEAVKRIKALGQ